MLFKLFHPVLQAPLHFIVSSDGCLFVKAAELAKTLGYANPSHFVLKTAKLTVKDIVYKRIRLPISLRKTWIYSVDEAKELMGRHVNPEAFQDILDRGKVKVPKDLKLTMKWKEAGTVQVVMRSEKTFSEFFEEFKVRVLEYFDKNIFEHKTVHIHRPLFGNLDLEYAPLKIKVFVGKKSYFYKRCG